MLVRSLKDLKIAAKAAAQHQPLISELNALAKDIERCERTITELKLELEAVNLKHLARKTTREDIAYLTELLNCAKKKLAWEKQLASVQKRAPVVLETMTGVINDTRNPPPEDVRASILQALQAVHTAMERLQNVNLA